MDFSYYDDVLLACLADNWYTMACEEMINDGKI